MSQIRSIGMSLLRVVLFALFVVGFVGTCKLLWRIDKTGYSTVDLQLARTPKHALATLQGIGAHRDLALESVDLDRYLIPSYTIASIALAFCLGISLKGIHRHALLVAEGVSLLTLLAAGCDWQENVWLIQELTSPPQEILSLTPDLAGLTFLISTSKFVLFAIVIAAEIAGIIDLGRWIWRQRATAKPAADHPVAAGAEASDEFRELYWLERQALKRPDEPPPQKDEAFVTKPGTSDEPWVAYRPDDKVGLALSGGGIRSATFNLGLLQALFDLRVLPLVDYLSTVSGGGYIGGWWTAWLQRRTAGRTSILPVATPPAGVVPELREANEVRHLREFSMFLSPRWGFFEVEMWNGLVAVLSGAIIALFATACMAFPIFGSWLVAAFVLWSTRPLVSAIAMTALTAVILWVFERWWQGSDDPEPQTIQLSKPFGVCILMAIPALLTGLGWWGLERLWEQFGKSSLRLLWLDRLDACGLADQWPLLLWIFSPAAIWFLVAVIVMVFRLLFSRKPSDRSNRDLRDAIDRVLGRLLGAATVWSLASLIWLAARFIDGGGIRILITGLSALAGGGAFTFLRNWLARSATRPATASPLNKLRRMLPALLAYVTIALLGVLVAVVMIEILLLPFGFSSVLGIAVLALYLLASLWDTKHFGLHEFYSDRIARSYLGASNPDAHDAADNRQADRRENDDLQLDKLRNADGVQRPIHLVCCTANMLADDNLGTLGRGARSAVLSCFGISIGNFWAPRRELRLGSALTASAAAFNSNMGSVSRQLGPGVTFLMSALNLRLGLWERHPLSQRKDWGWLPGMLFFREMFGQTSCQIKSLPNGDREPSCDDVHLSDGAHFENLGLYELVRRHCRYVIVSDCGDDGEFAFDDFGNAVRRIREDFGVEIQIDLEPLKPNVDERSRQHMVVGTIHYDRGSLWQAANAAVGQTGRFNDKGTLLYFKPNLTGTEPTDVRQYKTRNAAFPHESTADQFYDEAQWEAYRRLGEHAAWTALSFLEEHQPVTGNPLQAADVFNLARVAWYPTPADLTSQFEKYTNRFSQLEEQLRTEAPVWLMRELFPELDKIQPAPPSERSEAELMSGLHFVLQIVQLMENVCVGCYMETHWNHPLNLGWTNLFHRWVNTVTFRLWWPVIKPLFGERLRTYVDRRLISRAGPATPSGILQRSISDGPALAAWHRARQASPPNNVTYFGYNLTLIDEERRQTVPVQAAVAVIEPVEGDRVKWQSGDLFVLPGLWGTGIGSDFLKSLIQALTEDGVGQAIIELEPPLGNDGRSLEAYADLIAFYSRAGFRPSSSQNQLILRLRD